MTPGELPVLLGILLGKAQLDIAPDDRPAFATHGVRQSAK